ncbi:citrate/2-methylcitrate synthase [Pradoshia sp.]
MKYPGLKGVIAAETEISHIDGIKGELWYRGYDVRDILEGATFEQAAYLLWYGVIPNDDQLASLTASLKESRELSPYMKNIIELLPRNMSMMEVLRTVISAEGTSDYQWEPTVEQAIRLTAIPPVIIAYRKRWLEGHELVHPDPSLNHVENYLYMLNGANPTKAQVNALESYMILTIEHGMNASTFAARVTASTESDMVSGITSAIGTMKGPLHGGAPKGVIQLLDVIQAAGSPVPVLQKKVANGEKLMGFGHRIYKTYDPRALALKKRLLPFMGKDPWLDLAIEVEEAAIKVLQEWKPNRALYTNVEFYAAAIMKAIDMDQELFTPTFTASRMVGWTAHIIEQAQNNIIFRPESDFIGTPRKLPQ